MNVVGVTVAALSAAAVVEVEEVLTVVAAEIAEIAAVGNRANGPLKTIKFRESSQLNRS